MRHTFSVPAALLALFAALGVFAPSAFGQDGGLTTQQKLEKLRAARDAARANAKATATATATTPPTTTATTPPPPIPTPTPPPSVLSTAPPASASATSAKSAVPTTSGSAPLVTPPPELPNDIEQLRSTRDQRRKDEVAKLRQRWGELLADDRAKAELKLHAERVAFLQRIRALAVEAKDTKTTEKVDNLIDRKSVV